MIAKMVQKRTFVDEELVKVPAKHPRQLEHDSELNLFSESVPSDSALHRPFSLGIEGIETSALQSLSFSSWATSSIKEDDIGADVAVHVPFSPEYSGYGHPIRTILHSQEIYSLFLAQSPRKSVPIGKDYQADVPIWIPKGNLNTAHCSDSSELVCSDLEPLSDIDYEKEMMGTCIIPMPDTETSVKLVSEVGNSKDESCMCDDGGSVRCIRQHIVEAREKLRGTLGQENFLELGFCDMGEELADKWSDDEEHLFHEVVFSNPASLGKNFWDTLSEVFPSKAKKDIVSYYFNVFMLRRRAEQNRYDPVNIDSDNDEWHASDDSSEGELGLQEGDDDSVVESPFYGVDPGSERSPGNISEYDEDGIDETAYNYGSSVGCVGSKAILHEVPEACTGNNAHGLDPAFPSGKALLKEQDDQDAQDDSCTSSDTGAGVQGGLETKVENNDQWTSSFNSLHGGGGHSFVLEPCDAKLWDSGYMTCSKNELEFLPTYSVIEEVFGDGDWDHKETEKR